MLEECEVKPDRIDIFVASEAERKAYRAVLGPRYNLIVGVPGIHRQREFIHHYYWKGERVLCIDDDVRALKTLYPGVPFDVLIEEMFNVAETHGCRLWGVYPTDNGLQLQDRAVKGLKFIIGAFFGMSNFHASYPDPTTEDWTRTVLSYLEDGAVIRFEGVGIQTSYQTEPGGLQLYRTADLQDAEMRRLVKRFPDFLELRHKPGRYTDVRVRRLETEKIPNPFGC